MDLIGPRRRHPGLGIFEGDHRLALDAVHHDVLQQVDLWRKDGLPNIHGKWCGFSFFLLERKAGGLKCDERSQGERGTRVHVLRVSRNQAMTATNFGSSENKPARATCTPMVSNHGTEILRT